MDDEKAIVDIGQEILINSGYTVIIAHDGETALELYDHRTDGIDLVILDLGMPGMGGQRCLEELHTIDPEVKVIIATGYTGGEEVRRALECGARRVINKPYRANDLLTIVRKALDND